MENTTLPPIIQIDFSLNVCWFDRPLIHSTASVQKMEACTNLSKLMRSNQWLEGIALPGKLQRPKTKKVHARLQRVWNQKDFFWEEDVGLVSNQRTVIAGRKQITFIQTTFNIDFDHPAIAIRGGVYQFRLGIQQRIYFKHLGCNGHKQI